MVTMNAFSKPISPNLRDVISLVMAAEEMHKDTTGLQAG
jgi:hypothetical protein